MRIKWTTARTAFRTVLPFTKSYVYVTVQSWVQRPDPVRVEGCSDGAPLNPRSRARPLEPLSALRARAFPLALQADLGPRPSRKPLLVLLAAPSLLSPRTPCPHSAAPAAPDARPCVSLLPSNPVHPRELFHPFLVRPGDARGLRPHCRLDVERPVPTPRPRSHCIPDLSGSALALHTQLGVACRNLKLIASRLRGVPGPLPGAPGRGSGPDLLPAHLLPARRSSPQAACHPASRPLGSALPLARGAPSVS